jgi:hypothetical protein
MRDGALCLGRPLNEVDPTLTWPKLELAVELAPLDVRYYRWVSNQYIPRQLGNELCASPKDEILAFFENEKLARVSLRFYNTDECPDRSKWLKRFARGAETTISDLQGGKFVDRRGNSIFLLGWSGQKVTVVDVALRSSGYISSDDWVAFVKKYLEGDSIKS